jgi:transposase
MPGPRPRHVTLAREVQDKLHAVCRAATSSQREALRARIVLLAAQGCDNAQIGRRVGVTVSTVRKWRGRFVTSGARGLRDRPRSGRPCRFDAVTRSQIISLACRPVPEEMCRSHWTHEDLRRALLAGGFAASISISTVSRVVNEVDLRPQRFRMWLHSPDPLFRPKSLPLDRQGVSPADWNR